MRPHYIDNKQFLLAMDDYAKSVRRAKRNKEEKPRVPEYIGDCFIKIATHLAYKPNFINYTFRDEMIADAIENCLIYIDNFDSKKSKNPFAYFTQIAYYAFVRRIQKEQRHQHTKNRYIQSLDIDAIIRQAHDEGEYNNPFVQYLQQQADLAQQVDAGYTKKETPMKRRPKYMDTKPVLEESELSNT